MAAVSKVVVWRSLVVILLATAILALLRYDRVQSVVQHAIRPGLLSQSHLPLADQCAACHTPIMGVDASKCIACHANNTALLQRQPTAFHGDIQICSGCHVEHQGGVRMPTTMDHAWLAKIGHRELRASGVSGLDPRAASSLADWIHPRPGEPATLTRQLPSTHPGTRADESMLNCVGCHGTKDRHWGQFGEDCVRCHATTQWTIATFRHPSLRSTDCAQCHKPPPSHTMMHFSMISQPTAHEPSAKVYQCYLCHQTTAWNDIKGVGLVKHH